MEAKQIELLREVLLLRMAELYELQSKVATQFAKDGITAEIEELKEILDLF